MNCRGENEPGPYPIPLDAPVEAGGPGESGRLLVLDRDNWKLYEITGARREGAGWRAAGGAVFDLNSNSLRPKGWTSADPAGLPIFPGLVRYDEAVEQQAIRHALHFSCRKTRHAFVAGATRPAESTIRACRPWECRPAQGECRYRRLFAAGPGGPPSSQDARHVSGESRLRLVPQRHPRPAWNGIDMKSLQRIQGKDFEVVRLEKVETTEK